MSEPTEFHVHVYFSQETIELARALCETLRDRFDIEMGRMHRKPVGPHPCWSCQLRVPPEKLGAVMIYLSTNRAGLTIFTHAETGDPLADHTNHAIWMGGILPLDLSIFASTGSTD